MARSCLGSLECCGSGLLHPCQGSPLDHVVLPVHPVGTRDAAPAATQSQTVAWPAGLEDAGVEDEIPPSSLGT